MLFNAGPFTVEMVSWSRFLYSESIVKRKDWIIPWARHRIRLKLKKAVDVLFKKMRED
jgi:hypothetical protein